MKALLVALAGCSSGTLVTPTGLPDHARARVLTAQISPQAVVVAGVEPGETWVDLDDPVDARYGFQYTIEDAAGDALYQRTLTGPTIVESFLDYWSEQTRFDILSALPTLGMFPLPIPILDGGVRVRFRVRDESGEYAERGVFDLGSLDDPSFELEPPFGVVTGWETVRGTGADPANQLDLAIVGDGFTKDELPKFRAAVEEIADAFLATEPYATYADRVNIYRVDAVSANSGISYDCQTGCHTLDTAFDTVFAIEAVNGLLGTDYSSRALFQADQWAVAQAVSVVPWDAVLVVANTQQYGGMAVHYATTTLYPDYAFTSVHELGHAISYLGDEYADDSCIRSNSLGLPDNITDSPRQPPWPQWVDAATPLPTPDEGRYGSQIGAFPPAYNCDDLYRPARHCIMNDRGGFCDVCAELVTRRLYRHVDPADAIALDSSGHRWTVSFEGAFREEAAQVLVDGTVIADGTTSEPIEFTRPRGDVLTVEVHAASPFVRDDKGDLVQSDSWSLQ